jgi:Inner membrane protein YgaP-like, transmembrane domain
MKKTRFKTNMGPFDRMVRLCAGFGLILAGSLVVPGTIGTILLVIGIVAVLTAAIGFCPGYVPFGISTAGFPFAQPEIMSKMMTQCCGDSSGWSGCQGIMERMSGTSGDTPSGQGRE